jgi:magnesium transporter
LTEKYDLHDIIVEDMEESSTQDKIDVYDECLFLVLHFPKFQRENKRYGMNEFNCILGKNYIVTITKYRTSFIEKIKEEYTEELQEDKDDGHEALYKVSPYYILYRIIDSMFDKTLFGIKQFQADMGSIEQKVFDRHHQETTIIEELMQKRRNIVTLRHMINPQTEIITELQKETEKLFGGELEVYFEDLLYKVDKIHSHINILQEDIDSLYDAANTLTNIRINKTMKIFTIFTAII